MSYQVLARKWRPASFQQMVGQEHVVQALVNALDSDRLHHAYLFSGTRGVGKTTVARIFAKALNCEQGVGSNPCGECSSCNEIDQGRSVDLIEIDAASRTGVDDMRELLDNVQYAPTRGRFKIYLIDEVHMLSRHSFNALLKTLEEPPPHIKFLLATTDPQKVPVTVLSRCLQFSLKRMSHAQILAQLEYLTVQESVEVETGALAQLAKAADGSMRDALSLLDQAISYGGGAVRQAAVETMLGSISRDYLLRLFDALAASSAVDMLREARAVTEHNPDYQRVCAEMISVLQRVALHQADPELTLGEPLSRGDIEKYASRWAAEEVQLYYQILLQGRQDLLISPDMASGFEMLMLRLLAFAPQTEVSEGVKKKPELSVLPAAARTAAVEPEQATASGMDSETKVPPEPTNTAEMHEDPDSSSITDAGPIKRNEAANTVEAAPAEDHHDSLDWSSLAYSLGLAGLAQEIAANSSLDSYENGRLRLILQPEIHELASATVEAEIKRALEQKLQVSLQLVLESGDAPTRSTPLQVKLERQQQERLAAIDGIRQEQTVKKLAQALSAELDEASVVRIEDEDKSRGKVMKGALGDMMKKAQEMQENLQKAQRELANKEITGESGGGMVAVVMRGTHEVNRVKIDPSLIDEDVEMLEDLIAAAINDAVHKIEKSNQAAMQEMTAGLNLPPGFKLPF